MQHDWDTARITQAGDDAQVTGRVKLFTVDNTENSDLTQWRVLLQLWQEKNFALTALYEIKNPDITDIRETGTGFSADITRICTRDIKLRFK